MNLTADEVEVIAITIHETGDTALEQRFRDAARPSGAGKPPTDPAWGALTRALVVEGIEARKANRPADLTGVVLDHRPSIEGAVLATIANPAPAGPDVPMSPADIQRLITAARLAAPAGLDVEQLERALIAMATQNDPLEPGEVLVSIALEPDDPALLAGNIAYYYNLAEAAARPSGEWFCPGGWKLEQHYDPDAARPSGDAHGELDARLWHSAVCKNAAARPSGLATLTCNHCGDDLTVSELEGHLLSEGRVIPGLDAANPAPAALTADEVLIAAQKAGIDWWGTEDGGVTFVTPDPAAAEAPWWPLGDPARMAKLDAWAEKYVLAESREGEEGT